MWSSGLSVGFACCSPGFKSCSNLWFGFVSDCPAFTNNELVASCQLGFLIMFLLSLNCFFQIIKPWGARKLHCSLIATVISGQLPAGNVYIFPQTVVGAGYRKVRVIIM